MKRQLPEIHDYHASHYFGQLESFLGTCNIERHLASIEREMAAETGFYLREWVLPRNAWWLGLKMARDRIRNGHSFRGGIPPIMDGPFQTAIKLSFLYRTMPKWKRSEFRSRITRGENLDATLFEIDNAAHFWQLGYEIEWFENPSSPNLRLPEFIAKCAEQEIEVECKSKRMDAGRKIERRAFLRTVDCLIPVVQNKKLCGSIFLAVQDRMPVTEEWRRDIHQLLNDKLVKGSGSIGLSKGEIIKFDMRKADGGEIPLSSLAGRAGVANNPYAYSAVVGGKKRDFLVDPLLFRFESAKPDAFLKNVLSSLRNAQEQFTGIRASLITCMLPEIDSFEGLQADSALQKVTYFFFENHARDCINAVSYVSDARREIGGSIILSKMPAVTFRNLGYNKKYGPDIQVSLKGPSPS